MKLAKKWSHICDHSHKAVKEDPADPYYFDMFQVCSFNVKETYSPLRVVQCSQKIKTSKILHLCSKCHTFLVHGGKKGKPTKISDQQLELHVVVLLLEFINGLRHFN